MRLTATIVITAILSPSLFAGPVEDARAAIALANASKPITPIPNKVDTCPIKGGACTCGCNEGFPCVCIGKKPVSPTSECYNCTLPKSFSANKFVPRRIEVIPQTITPAPPSPTYAPVQNYVPTQTYYQPTMTYYVPSSPTYTPTYYSTPSYSPQVTSVFSPGISYRGSVGNCSSSG